MSRFRVWILWASEREGAAERARERETERHDPFGSIQLATLQRLSAAVLLLCFAEFDAGPSSTEVDRLWQPFGRHPAPWALGPQRFEDERGNAPLAPC